MINQISQKKVYHLWRTANQLSLLEISNDATSQTVYINVCFGLHRVVNDTWGPDFQYIFLLLLLLCWLFELQLILFMFLCINFVFICLSHILSVLFQGNTPYLKSVESEDTKLQEFLKSELLNIHLKSKLRTKSIQCTADLETRPAAAQEQERFCLSCLHVLLVLIVTSTDLQ